jgi:hypothetical protein
MVNGVDFRLTLPEGERWSLVFVSCLLTTGHKFDELLVVGLERGPLSLVSTTEELLDRKVAAPV